MYIYIYIYGVTLYICVHMYIYIWCNSIHMCTYVYIYIYTCIYIYIYEFVAKCVNTGKIIHSNNHDKNNIENCGCIAYK